MISRAPQWAGVGSGLEAGQVGMGSPVLSLLHCGSLGQSLHLLCKKGEMRVVPLLVVARVK